MLSRLNISSFLPPETAVLDEARIAGSVMGSDGMGLIYTVGLHQSKLMVIKHRSDGTLLMWRELDQLKFETDAHVSSRRRECIQLIL
jgi:hypothetical protein